MTVERFHTRQNLAVVTAVDKHLQGGSGPMALPDGWNTNSFPFGFARPIFRCYVLLVLNLGSVSGGFSTANGRVQQKVGALGERL